RDRRPALDAGRDLDRVALRPPLAAGTVAARARILDHRPVAAAARARLREAEEALALDLHAAAVALRADRRRGAGLRARAAALAASSVDLDRDLGLDAAQRVLEREVDHRLEVGSAHPALGARPRAAAAPAAAEEPAEQVAEIADVEVEARAAEPAGPRHPIRAEGVVLLPLLRVGEEVVGVLHLLEPLLGGVVARVPVRVVLAGELAVGLLDLVRGRRLRDAEGLIRVRHAALSSGGPADTTTRAGRRPRSPSEWPFWITW